MEPGLVRRVQVSCLPTGTTISTETGTITLRYRPRPRCNSGTACVLDKMPTLSTARRCYLPAVTGDQRGYGRKCRKTFASLQNPALQPRLQDAGTRGCIVVAPSSIISSSRGGETSVSYT